MFQGKQLCYHSRCDNAFGEQWLFNPLEIEFSISDWSFDGISTVREILSVLKSVPDNEIIPHERMWREISRVNEPLDHLANAKQMHWFSTIILVIRFHETTVNIVKISFELSFWGSCHVKCCLSEVTKICYI